MRHPRIQVLLLRARVSSSFSGKTKTQNELSCNIIRPLVNPPHQPTKTKSLKWYILGLKATDGIEKRVEVCLYYNLLFKYADTGTYFNQACLSCGTLLLNLLIRNFRVGLSASAKSFRNFEKVTMPQAMPQVNNPEKRHPTSHTPFQMRRIANHDPKADKTNKQHNQRGMSLQPCTVRAKKLTVGCRQQSKMRVDH